MRAVPTIICLLVWLHGYSQTAQNVKDQKKRTKETPVALSATTRLSGVYYSPPGIGITLQNNGKNDLILLSAIEKGRSFTESPFSFTSVLDNGSKYNVTTKKTTPGQRIFFYPSSAGRLPQDGKLTICSDYAYDLVSRDSKDLRFSTFYESSDPDVGGYPGEEGRYVTFISSAVGFAGGTGKHRQVYWRDRNESITKLISISTSGDEGNGDCYAPVISGNGKFVAFESLATNLVENDKNAVKDIFLWNAETGKLEKVSITHEEKEANAECYEASVSGDGNRIAFTSTADNLSSTGKGSSNNNVFLRDMKAGTTIMVSIDAVSKNGGGGSNASISFDGRRLAFYSHTATLVSNDKNGLWDIFLWDENKPGLKRISLTSDGKEREQGIESTNRIVAPSISGNGRYVVFSTTAKNMVPNDKDNYQDVFMYDSETNKIVPISTNIDGTMGNGDSPIGQGEKIAINYDGTLVAFATKSTNLGVPSANIVLHQVATGKNLAISGLPGSSVGRATISYSGSYVVFGIGGKLDSRFSSSGIFASYNGLGPCRFLPVQ